MSDTPTSPVPSLSTAQVLALMDLSRAILSGQITDPSDVARALVDLSLDLAPVELLAPYLTTSAVARAKRIADAYEAARFGR